MIKKKVNFNILVTKKKEFVILAIFSRYKYKNNI